MRWHVNNSFVVFLSREPDTRKQLKHSGFLLLFSYFLLVFGFPDEIPKLVVCILQDIALRSGLIAISNYTQLLHWVQGFVKHFLPHIIMPIETKYRCINVLVELEGWYIIPRKHVSSDYSILRNERRTFGVVQRNTVRI